MASERTGYAAGGAVTGAGGVLVLIAAAVAPKGSVLTSSGLFWAGVAVAAVGFAILLFTSGKHLFDLIGGAIRSWRHRKSRVRGRRVRSWKSEVPQSSKDVQPTEQVEAANVAQTAAPTPLPAVFLGSAASATHEVDPEVLWRQFPVSGTDVQNRTLTSTFWGQVVKVSGTVSNVTTSIAGYGSFAETRLVWVDVGEHRSVGLSFLDRAVWSRLHQLTVGDSITARGSFQSMERSLMSLGNCELLPEPAKGISRSFSGSASGPNEKSASGIGASTAGDEQLAGDVDLTPEDLWSLFTGTELQAQRAVGGYMDRFLVVSGAIGSVGGWQDFGPAVGGFSLVALDRPDTHYIFLVFRDKRWLDRLMIAHKGDAITARGRIVELNGSQLKLDDCEIR